MAEVSGIVPQPLLANSSDGDSGCALDEYTWVPPGLTAQQIAEYMHALPTHCVPYAGGSIGDRWRTTQLLRQLPPQDTEVRYCHGLSDEEKRELRLFSAQRRHDALGRATVQPVTVSAKCQQCAGGMHVGELSVCASRAEHGTVWHPGCFMCSVCQELLVDLIYFYGKDSQLYCGRHHAVTLKPRCSACDEIIFSDECTEAEGHSWHTKHFVCCDCEQPLGGQRYVMTDGRPFCCVCYERLYAAECATCRQTIRVSDGHMVHGSRRWHATDACFCCDSCSSSLLGCPFIAVPGKDAIYCASCGINCCTTTSLSDVNKLAGAVDPSCFSPNSPRMKVRETTSKAFCGGFEEADSRLTSAYVGGTWCEQSPVQPGAKYVSPRNSPVQCKPVIDELQTLSACATNLTSCCDDHRLSAEFQACSSSVVEQNSRAELSSHNEKLSQRVSPMKHSVSDLMFSACATQYNTNVAPSDIVSPRPPVLSSHADDYLQSADEINARLEELIVEPVWSREEPEGIVAGSTEVLGITDDGHQRSRKSKNLNVRFDPSTKDPLSPAPHGVYCERRHRSSRRSLDDSDIAYMSSSSHGYNVGADGSASVRIRRRGRNHAGAMTRGSGWWVDTDDYEHCSTCSSSSSDSDFDYDDCMSARAASLQSHTLPHRGHHTGSASTAAVSRQVQRSRKLKKKQCVLS